MRPKPDAPIPGQESVWEYPRPAVAEPCAKRLRVVFGGKLIAETVQGVRTLETSHPPTYYFPPADVDVSVLVPVAGRSLCEWKGQARYFDVVAGSVRADRSAWAYDNPAPTFSILAHFIAFMPGSMDACFVGGERAQPQDGSFYGGWITSDLAGPFKGGPGSRFW